MTQCLHLNSLGDHPDQDGLRQRVILTVHRPLANHDGAAAVARENRSVNQKPTVFRVAIEIALHHGWVLDAMLARHDPQPDPIVDCSRLWNQIRLSLRELYRRVGIDEACSLGVEVHQGAVVEGLTSRER